jgi:hypothetical protein
MLADVVLLLQCVPLDQVQNQCREADDCQRRARNYDGSCASASARQSLSIRDEAIRAICKPSNDLKFHLVHHCNQMQPLARAWQNTSAVSSPVRFGSPLSTPIQTRFLFETGVVNWDFMTPAVSPTIANARRKSTRKWQSLQSSWR